jgi:hypothetical protein
MDDDLFENSFEAERDEPCVGDLEPEAEDGPDESESNVGEFTTKDKPCDDSLSACEMAFLGGVMGFAFDEGQRDRIRRKRKRFKYDSE